MPARAVKRGDKWRVVEPSGKLVRNRAGTPVDGGGYKSKAHAARQARAINAHEFGSSGSNKKKRR